MAIEEIVARQRAFFETGRTLPVAYRQRALERLYAETKRREKDVADALYSDLGKAPFESYMTEVGITLGELGFLRKWLPLWAQDRWVPTPLTHFPSQSFVRHEPYGVTLVMAPWNYPFLLSVEPLAGAVAAGNCVVLKPSAYAPATSALLRELVEHCFEPGHVQVVEGGRAENSALLEQRFDYIFFTGSVAVGKTVMEKAAKNLTPVSLELGGKSPVIVDETANIKVAGRRIAFGKFLNAGQTCVAPDYLLVHERVKAPLLAAIRQATREFLGERPLENPELPRIVNGKHFERLRGLLQGQEIYFGGGDDGLSRIEPTVLNNTSPQSPVMQEEIFGPILPVMTFERMGEAIAFVNAREKPLALYLFTRSPVVERQVLARCSFGGGCINDTIVHLATSHMGFGGVGHSGMGSYHGKKSFDTFTHEKSILKKANWPDLPVRYHPYNKWKDIVLRALLK